MEAVKQISQAKQLKRNQSTTTDGPGCSKKNLLKSSDGNRDRLFFVKNLCNRSYRVE